MSPETSTPQVASMQFVPSFDEANSAPNKRDTALDGKSFYERAAHRFSLAGKRAIVTGGAQGLGLACSKALLEHGVTHLVIFDIEEELGKEAVSHLESHNAAGSGSAEIMFRKVDVTKENELQKIMHDLAVQLGGIDILLCFAGIVNCEHAVDYQADNWRKIIDVNTTGSFLTAQALAREMISRSHPCSIVFAASMSGRIVNYPQTHAAYCVSKAGVHQLTRTLAAEWAIHKIRVNSISPGYMDTRLNAGDALLTARKIWYERTPMGRMGNPEDLTGAVVLLCSEAGRFMTGSDITIDGGYTIF